LTFGPMRGAASHRRVGRVTVYAELLKLALAEEDASNQPTEALVADAIALKERLNAQADAQTRLAAALAYDVALARLCDSLALEHQLTGEAAGAVARRRTERALASVLPTLEGALR
jgi:hypothetical protein